MNVVVIGGGFGGLNAARDLDGSAARVILIDRSNHHLFQPLLYQVATAALSPSDVAEPIRSILSRAGNVEVRLGEVTEIDLPGHRVKVVRGDHEGWVRWDRLVIAAGARHAYFGHPEWEQHAPGLKTIADALDIRRRVLEAFERAEWTDDPDERAALLTFVVIGAGPTGVELAGALAEIARHTVRRDFRRIDTATARVVLLEGGPVVLPPMPDPLQDRARRQLERIGVEVRTSAMVTGVDDRGVSIGDERIQARTVLWAAGVQASRLTAQLGVPTDRAGRVTVGPDLSIPGHPDVFAIGDLAVFHQDGAPLPGIAPVAMNQGRHVARCIRADLGGAPRPAFRHHDRGNLATIGRSKAVGVVFGRNLSGLVAWVLWVVVHLATLVTYRNRIVVFTKWAWAWISWDRAARLLWQRDPPRIQG